MQQGGATQAFFLPAAAGQRLCIFHRAAGAPVRGRIVYIHPFADEMNKARRMAAQQARAFAAAGYSVLQIDLQGCGDSSGDFGDASWQGWIADVLLACGWLRQIDDAHARAPLWLWGLRAGCLLAVEAATRLPEPSNFCFWQPPATGKLLLQQFLRLRLAADMLQGNTKGLMDEMRQQLARGESLEVAGYRLAPALAAGLERATLQPGSLRAGRLAWFELGSRPEPALTPVAGQGVAQWRAAGWQVGALPVHGPAFWQTTEIEDAPALLAATLAALQEETQQEAEAAAEPLLST
ncbi:MAG: hydrolase 2, exosortase A system-associated [Burkholderiaceae bacterium]